MDQNNTMQQFHITAIPRVERLRLEAEERETLPEEAKKVWDTTGWKTQPFFIGKKKDGTTIEYRDWKEFAEIGEKVMPIQNERLKHTNQAQADEIAKLKSDIARMSELQRMQAERNLKKDKAEVENELREYRSIGVAGEDVDKFAAAQARKVEIELEEKMLKQFEPQQFSMPQHDKLQIKAEEIAFKARNPWFDNDRVMQRYAVGADVELHAANPNLSPAEHFRLLEDEIKREFPDKFKSEGVHAAAAVESGRNSGNAAVTSRAGNIAFEQLPKAEQERADQMIRLKIGGYKTRADFMEKYNKNNKK